MTRLLAFVIAAVIIGAPTLANDDDTPVQLVPLEGVDVDLNDFLWVARPLVVFADSPNDPRFIKQMELLAERPEELAVRDVVVITDTDRDEMSDIRRSLRPRGFMLALIGKDGKVFLRKPAPWDVRDHPADRQDATEKAGNPRRPEGRGRVTALPRQYCEAGGHSNSMITSSTARLSPGAALIFATVSFFSDRRMFSIFIASTVQSA